MTSGKNSVEKQFKQLVSGDKRDYRFDELMLSMRVLSEVERLMDERDVNKAQLAEALGVSAPYITMLFQGEKILNLEKIARIQDFFGVDFKIQAEERQSTFSTSLVEQYMEIETDWIQVVHIAEPQPIYADKPISYEPNRPKLKAVC